MKDLPWPSITFYNLPWPLRIKMSINIHSRLQFDSSMTPGWPQDDPRWSTMTPGCHKCVMKISWMFHECSINILSMTTERPGELHILYSTLRAWHWSSLSLFTTINVFIPFQNYNYFFEYVCRFFEGLSTMF